MTSLLKKNFYALILVVVLAAIAAVRLPSTTAFAQGGFGYMCDAWEESCDDGSGDWWDTGGGGGGGGDFGGGNYICPYPEGCGSLGCHSTIANPTQQTCSTYPVVEGARCPGTLNCRKVGS